MTIATIKNHLFNENVPVNVPHDVPVNVPVEESDEDKIIKAIKVNNKITMDDMTDIISKSRKTVMRLLKASNKIKHIGSSKSGHWEIILEEPNEKTIQALQESEVISKDSSIKGYDIENALEELKK